jgi:hypothetical protein
LLLRIVCWLVGVERMQQAQDLPMGVEPRVSRAEARLWTASSVAGPITEPARCAIQSEGDLGTKLSSDDQVSRLLSAATLASA